MARGVKVRMNSAGAKALLNSNAVALDLGARADAIRNRANGMTTPDEMFNEPFESDLKRGSTRARASVFTATPHGVRANNKHNTLLKSVDAGR